MDEKEKQNIKEKCVLAMYDIRGKQDFIFKSTKMKEIMGSSAIIRDCYKDYLKPKAEKYNNGGKGIYGIDTKKEKHPFTENDFCKHIEEGYVGEIVYDGGGNFILLYKDAETCKDITYNFTKSVIKGTGTLKVICTYIEQVDFSDFQGDRRRLYDKHRKTEARLATSSPYATVPIVQADYQSSMPLVGIPPTEVTGEKIKVTRESAAKYEKYRQIYQGSEVKEDEKNLDKIVTKKGVESLLAVVYIDGNNMGAKVQKCLGKEKISYEESVKKLRGFSQKIQRDYIDARRAEIKGYLEKKYSDKMRRFVVYAGDEINFICNARDAFKLAKQYLENLPQNEYGECTSCAGIAIFHSHAPYADAYRIAEECCEFGKIRMKTLGVENLSYVDFHYCQGAIGTSLEDIRKEEVGDLISKPWLIAGSDKGSVEDDVKSKDIERMQNFLNELGRSNVKGLAEKAKQSMAELRLELHRINAHMTKEKREKLKADFKWIEDNRTKMRKLIYDMVIVYDLWFDKKQEKGEAK